MKNSRIFYASIFSLILLIIYFFPDQLRHTLSAIKEANIHLASVILGHKFKTPEQIKKNYELSFVDSTKRVRILIVPGHEPGYGGAEFKGVKERDLVVELAEQLKQFFQNSKQYNILVSRNSVEWNNDLEAYFQDHGDEIKEWKNASKKEFSSLINIGSINRPVPMVFHNDAPSDVADRLYGITKWSNENDIDIVLHIHFNDNPRNRLSLPGTNSGFAIYVPSEQFGNSKSTKVIANNIFQRLEKYNPISSLPGESTGIVDESELIAIGSNNTSDAASMLIEYGYIYEPQLQNPDVRNLVIRDMAYQTYLGIEDFFSPTISFNQNGTLVFPHAWDKNLTETNANLNDVFALQTALMIDGVYPPSGKSKNDCPRTGRIGSCTRASLQTFQDKYEITGERGIVGSETRRVLSEKY